MVKRIINSIYIVKNFGLKSKFFIESIEILNKKASTIQRELFEENFKEWKENYNKIYGESSLNTDLFIKQTYFVLLLKSLIIIKLASSKNHDLEVAFEYWKSNNLERSHLFEFERFYWIDANIKQMEKIYHLLEFTELGLQDLFFDLYQQIFFTKTRHKLGEFYTPSHLVHKMVDDLYKFGLKILDPSCGSGNFLIDIIIQILNTDTSNKSKIMAINNVYGFDINPLAVLTTKVNIFLIFLEYFDLETEQIPALNIILINSFFPEINEINNDFHINTLYNSFDLIIGNPPWLTYKDLSSKDYQTKVRNLAEELGIKPLSQYITHIELASIFFYLIPIKFLKLNGNIFFVITKSVLNGDHCYKFRAFSIFNNIEIWDFPSNYLFNIQYICLKAEYIGKEGKTSIKDKYPIKTKVFDENLELLEETLYSSLKIENNGAKIILPLQQLGMLNKISTSPYKNAFFQGATLVPRTLVFFKIDEKNNDQFVISTDPDIISRAKKEWNYKFQNKRIESNFGYKTFLNKDLIPFLLTKLRDVFLPVDDLLEFNLKYLKKYPLAMNFYNEMNKIYKQKKKITSDINTLFSNLNYWNKLTKQYNNKTYMVLYNASGSNLKAAVIQTIKKIIVGSENYYFSTESMEEAYYLSAILNSPILSRNIKLIKSSRHIHKRPFSFPIPIYEESNSKHKFLAEEAIKCESIVKELFLKNPKINNEKVKQSINKELNLINDKVEQIIFKEN